MLNIQQDDHEFRLAGELQARGQNAQAEHVCRRILARNPNHPGALHLLGIIAFSHGDAASAANLIEKSIASSPAPDAYSNLAEIRRQMGNLPAAVELCRKSLALDPNLVGAHLNMSLALLGLGQLAPALAHAQRARELQPNWARAAAHLGVVLVQSNRLLESVANFEQALRMNPADVSSAINLGNAYRELNEFDKAIASHQRALAAAPNNPNAWLSLGTSLAQSGKYEEGRMWLEKALAAAPNAPDPLQNLASLYVETREYEKAVACAKRGLEVAPERSLMWVVLQKAYTALGRFEEADAVLQKALAIEQSAPVWKAVAHNCSMAAWYEKGLEAAARAVQLEPQAPIHHFDHSMLLLTLGRFEEGWNEYEWRRKLREIKSNVPATSGREWNGESLEGKSIKLYTEQGHGDAIQFVRYVPLVAQRGGKVIIQCESPLKRLFERVKGVWQVLDVVEAPPTDYHLPLLSLAHVFNTTEATIPRNVPYIEAHPEDIAAWRDRLAGDPPALKVGLSWAGRPTHASDEVRSIASRELLPLMDIPGVRFYSLQKNLPPDQVAPLAQAGLVDHTALLNDFAQTAALIANLDLVISVDTAVAHLAGAMNKPTWLMLATYTDWRWQPKRQDSTWYPSMRLFRQTAFRDWPSVVQRVKNELQNRLASR